MRWSIGWRSHLIHALHGWTFARYNSLLTNTTARLYPYTNTFGYPKPGYRRYRRAYQALPPGNHQARPTDTNTATMIDQRYPANKIFARRPRFFTVNTKVTCASGTADCAVTTQARLAFFSSSCKVCRLYQPLCPISCTKLDTVLGLTVPDSEWGCSNLGEHEAINSRSFRSDPRSLRRARARLVSMPEAQTAPCDLLPFTVHSSRIRPVVRSFNGCSQPRQYQGAPTNRTHAPTIPGRTH